MEINKIDFVNSLGLAPELIDSIAHVQAAHEALSHLSASLEERDADLADDWRPTVNDLLEELGDMRSALLRMMTEIAACTWR